MSVDLKKLDIGKLRPRITIFGVGGAGGNAVNNMINAGLQGVDFVVANKAEETAAMQKIYDDRAAIPRPASVVGRSWRNC